MEYENRTHIVSASNYAFVDFVKFIGSIMIFIMHISFFGDYEGLDFLWQCLTRFAVPYFSVASAYFLFSKGENGNIDKTTLKKYCKRIMMLYLVWFIFNIPSTVYMFISFNFSERLEFLRKMPISSPIFGSWYLLGSVFGAVVVFYLCKKLNTKYCFLICSIVQIISISSSVYGGLLPQSVLDVLKWLCFPTNIVGLMYYFVVGKIIVEKREKINSIGTKWLIIILVLSGLIFAFEEYFSKLLSYNRSTDQAFGLAIFPAVMFLLSIRTKVKIKNSDKLRKISTIIYCCQGNVLEGAAYIRNLLNANFIVRGIIGFILLFFVIVAVFFIQKKFNKISLVKYLT